MEKYRFSLPVSALALLCLVTVVSLSSLGCGDDDDEGESGSGNAGGVKLTPDVSKQLSGESKNRMKQLAIAMHNYQDINKTLPPACTITADGKPGLSWRVLLLPFIEQNALFDQFNLEEPWDSPQNKPLLSKIPPIYKSLTGGGDPTATYYQVIVGPETPFLPVDMRKTKRDPSKGLKFWDISDGTANTILIVEAGTAVPWTKPDDVTYQRGGPLPQLGGMFADRLSVVLCDSAAFTFKKPMKTDKLDIAIMRNDGQPVQFDYMGPF